MYQNQLQSAILRNEMVFCFKGVGHQISHYPESNPIGTTTGGRGELTWGYFVGLLSGISFQSQRVYLAGEG